MNIRLPVTALLLLGSAVVATAEEKDFDPQHFVNTKCVGCHDSTVYTRPDRRVKSLDRLESQVRMCDANLNTGLFDDDLMAVVDYLNERYYELGE